MEQQDPWAILRRPLQTPSLPPVDHCPALTARAVTIDSVDIGHVLGTVPLFAKGGLTSADTDQGFGTLSPSGDGEVGYKTIWYGHPDYDGPLLTRGVQLDGSSAVQFDGMGSVDGRELRLTSDNAGRDQAAPGWRLWNTRTIVSQPGCYAWQIDGETFTTIIVFVVQP